MKPIIFIFGPSGVGKSYLFSLIKKQKFMGVHIDTDDIKRAFTSYGYPSEWDDDFTKVNFNVFMNKLQERLEIKHDGAVVSFPTTYRFTEEKLKFLRQLGVVPILLWGSEENCKQSAEKRINKKGMQFNLSRYDQKNLQTFQLYSRPEYDIFKLEAFQVDDSRLSDEELKKQIAGFMKKFSN